MLSQNPTHHRRVLSCWNKVVLSELTSMLAAEQDSPLFWHLLATRMNCITEKVHQLYDKLPACGKPREDEYTVLASIVAESSSGMNVVALATGTKCIGLDCGNEKGCLLSDSHGEVLARRCFVRYLSDWIIAIIDQPTSASADDCPFDWSDASDSLTLIKLKDSWRFHMYISDSPCGDASIYSSSLIEENGTNQTGAKLVPSSIDTIPGEKLGSLRTKSGRSDIKIENRTTSMSCSDKVCRWICLGLQGALMSLWTAPVRLSSMVVDQDPSSTEESQRNALLRALKERILLLPEANEETSEQTSSPRPLCDIPEVLIAPAETGFSRGKAAAKYTHPVEAASSVIPAGSEGTDRETEESVEPTAKRRKKNPLSPCGASVNWYRSCAATMRALATVTSALTTSTTIVAPQSQDAPTPAADATYSHKDNHSRPLKPRKVTEVAGGTVEVTIAHTGALQGSVKKCVGEISTASRLSPHAMRALFEHTVQVLHTHKDDSEAHKSLYAHVTQALSSEISLTGKEQEQNLLIPSNSLCTNADSLLSAIQQLSRRELKQRCGKCYYNQAKAQFLCHPIFKDWICDE